MSFHLTQRFSKWGPLTSSISMEEGGTDGHADSQVSSQSHWIRTLEVAPSNQAFYVILLRGQHVNHRSKESLRKWLLRESTVAASPRKWVAHECVTRDTSKLRILSTKLDHCSLVEENKPSAPSNSIIWLVPIWIPKDLPKTLRHKTQCVLLKNDSLDPSLDIVIGFRASEMSIFSLTKSLQNL